MNQRPKLSNQSKNKPWGLALTAVVLSFLLAGQLVGQQETAVLEPAAPETAVPKPITSETTVPEVIAPETVTPETALPEPTIPEPVIPETPTAELAAPEVPVQETAAPGTAEVQEPEKVVPAVPEVAIANADQSQEASPLISLSVQETTTLVSPQPIKQVLVANPGIVQVEAVSPVKLLLNGLQYGRTTLTLETADGEKLTYVVSVGLDLSALQATIEKLSPYSMVKTSSIMDTVILSGTVPDVQTSQKIMDIAGIYSSKIKNHMEMAGVQQVQLRVTIAEVSKTATRALGVNFQAAGSTAFGGSMVGAIQPLSMGFPNITPVAGTMPFATTGGDQVVSPSVTIFGGLTKANLEGFLIAMQDNNLVHILAEPTLITLNGREASFMAGGEFPIPVVQEGNSVTVEFREFGVRLSFTPTVLAGELIRLDVAPEVSEPDYTNAVQISGFTIPGRSIRNAKTTIELGSGQTFAIAGLLSNQTRASANRVPALGNLPVLGSLFRSVQYRRSETELLIIVTTELIEPLNPDQVAGIPGQNLADPNNFQLFGLGQIENTSAVPVERLRKGKELFTEPTRLKGRWGPTDMDEGS